MLCCSCFFFFQAEDGIRDLVRSRGLGDVYKRQKLGFPTANLEIDNFKLVPSEGVYSSLVRLGNILSVSYTHLTLPTSDLV